MKSTRGKKTISDHVEADEVLPEYDFSQARPNKYASRYSEGSIVVTPDPDVAAVFRGAQEVNDALRALADVIRNHEARHPSRGRA